MDTRTYSQINCRVSGKKYNNNKNKKNGEYNGALYLKSTMFREVKGRQKHSFCLVTLVTQLHQDNKGVNTVLLKKY